MSSNIAQLTNILSQYDWFDFIEQDEYGRYVVYSKYINNNVRSLVPSTVENKQLLLHFSAYAHAKPEVLYFGKTSTLNRLLNQLEDSSLSSNDTYVVLDQIMDELELMTDSFDRVEDIFYEIHDKQNAITNHSKNYPLVRSTLEKMYNMLGFDVLFDRYLS